MSENRTVILNIGKALLAIPFTALASIGGVVAGLTGHYDLAVLWAGLSALPAAGLTAYDPVKTQVMKLISLRSQKSEQLQVPTPDWWTSDARSWQDVCAEVEDHLQTILERMTELMRQDQRAKTSEVVQQIFSDALVEQHLTWAPDPQVRRRIGKALALPIWQKINEMLSPVIVQIQQEEAFRDIRTMAFKMKDAVDLLREIRDTVKPPLSGGERPILHPITTHTLLQAEQQAAVEIEKLKQLSRGEHDNFEYNDLMNDKALLGCPPQWRHLYLGEFGAFRRPAKEAQIITDMSMHLPKLVSKQQGLLLHVISGDSGCGKSTLAKQILRRLIDQEQLKDYPNLLSQKLSFFELELVGGEQNLEAELLAAIAPASQSEVYFIYFDDLFALEEKEVDRILTILTSAAERAPIYFLVTSPSWLFNFKKDLPKRKQTFNLVDCFQTIIGGMNNDDKQALKEQYKAMYGSHCREDLLKRIDGEDEAIVLLKLGLHHGMTYSQYLEELLKRLETKAPKYLAALLLFSILSRFYVHFPLPLLELINQELTGEKLPEHPDDYYTINDGGLRLFRIIRGTRISPDSSGMPDTLAPFHDRVAQVIYTTWGEKEQVPLFGCSLVELRNMVYRKLKEVPQTIPLLANVFRGHLRVADDSELDFFVRTYGPVQANNWAFCDVPLVAYRWIVYSGFNPVRTEKYRRNWEQVLENTIRKREEIQLVLSLALLNPNKLWELKDRTHLTNLRHLGTDYFLLMIGALEQLLSINPPPLEILGDYLSYLVEWLEAHPSTSGHFPTPCYLVIASLTGRHLIRIRSDFRRSLSQSISRVLKAYLLRLDQEYTNSAVFGADGLKALVRRIYWAPQDAAELVSSLRYTLQDRETKFRPSLMEILLQLATISDTSSINELFQLFIDICEQNSAFSGLTYTAESFGYFLDYYCQKHPEENKQFLRAVLDDLTEKTLNPLRMGTAYPNFVKNFITDLVYSHWTISPSELYALLRPLCELSSSLTTAYVFTEVVRMVTLSSTDFQELIHDNYDRQIQLCFAQKIHMPLDKALDEFIALLEAGDFRLLRPSVILLSNYLQTSKPKNFESLQLEKYRNWLYSWLEQGKESQEATYVFTLLNMPSLFSFVPMKDLEDVAIKNISLIPIQLPRRFFPFEYVKQWLSSEIDNPNKHDSKIILLDALWRHMLENSHFEIAENGQIVKGKFLMYEQHFMFLLTQYPITRDESWWVTSLKTALEYYTRLTSDQLQHKRQHKQVKKNQDSEEPKKKKQRDCLDQIIDTVLHQFALSKNTLTDAAQESLKAVFSQYQDQPWATHWISRLDAEVQSLDTTKLIDYIATLPYQTLDLFRIRNRFDWWAKWIQESGRDFSVELDAILKGIESMLKLSTTTVALSSLMSLVDKYLPKAAPSIEIILGSFVLASLEQSTSEFHNASELVKNYLEYLMEYDPTKKNIVVQEKPYLQKIGKWYLDEAIRRSEMDFTPYGLQILFETLAKFEIEVDIPLAERAFLAVSEAQLDHEAGGAISRYYFKWLFKQSQPFSIQPYIDFINTNQKREQAPYFMFFMVVALDTSPNPLNLEDCKSYWQILKSLICSRLRNHGVTLASEHYCSYFVNHYVNLEGGQEFLRQLSKEAFEVVQEVINHRRIFFLLPTFFPVWQASIIYPSSREILHLWQILLGRLQNSRDMEAFGTFTRDLLKSLEVENDASLFEEFYQTSLDFIEKNLRHELSPKLCSTLSLRRANIDKIVEILPKLMHYQAALEDTAYALDRFFRICSSSLDDSSRTEFEGSLIEALDHNLGKPFAEKCLIEVLKHCQPKVHYLEISQLFRTYLTIGKEPEKKEDESEFWRVFTLYRKYEKRSDIEQESIRRNLIDYLLVIQNIAKKPVAARYLDAVLGTWSSQDVPLATAIDAFEAILIEVKPQRWQRIMHLCKRYIKLFGESTLLAPNLSIRDVLFLLEMNEHEGLILIKQKLRLLN